MLAINNYKQTAWAVDNVKEEGSVFFVRLIFFISCAIVF